MPIRPYIVDFSLNDRHRLQIVNRHRNPSCILQSHRFLSAGKSITLRSVMICHSMKILQLIALLIAGLPSLHVQAGQSRQTLLQDGVLREYQLFIPSSYDQEKPAPLLLALHGRTGDGQRMADLTSFNSRADEHGFIAVYPDGVDKQWNYLHGISGYREQPNDSKFLLAIIAAVRNKFNINSKRIYVTGISNGGFMAQRLACYAPDKFSAFASVAAGGYAAMAIACVDGGPVNMLYMHGTADTKVPWQGLAVADAAGNRQPVTMSITGSVKFWSGRNRCSADVDSREIPVKGNSPGTRVKVLSARHCMDSAAVVLYAIIGGGHNWPGAPGIIAPAIAGEVNMDIHASDVIWSFFSATTPR